MSSLEGGDFFRHLLRDFGGIAFTRVSIRPNRTAGSNAHGKASETSTTLPLPEEYIWAAGDVTAKRLDCSHFPGRVPIFALFHTFFVRISVSGRFRSAERCRLQHRAGRRFSSMGNSSGSFLPTSPKMNFHLSLQADGTSGYSVSLAHGWSSYPLARSTSRRCSATSTVSPRWFKTSIASTTTPWSLRLGSGRFSLIDTMTRMVSFRNTGRTKRRRS